MNLLTLELKGLCNFNTIHATGGGAFKFYNMVYDKLQVKFEKHDELLSLVSGYTFMNAYRSFYEFNQKDKTIRILQPEELVNKLFHLDFPSYCS